MTGKGWAEADSRFHTHLLEFCGNRRLARIGAAMMDQIHRVRLLTLHIRPKPTDSTADHRSLLNAIRNHDEMTTCPLPCPNAKSLLPHLPDLPGRQAVETVEKHRITEGWHALFERIAKPLHGDKSYRGFESQKCL